MRCKEWGAYTPKHGIGVDGGRCLLQAEHRGSHIPMTDVMADEVGRVLAAQGRDAKSLSEDELAELAITVCEVTQP